ncbi:ABC transporter substrate-binding protein [Brachybacterium sp. J153]|uniref:ABC transporter substrate-binding protein n=1 Tax=Brachybacterium sp. J153 TaxID=3116488 RepID=UPI002E76A7A2|nr:ABC transporter substrate-binding protein [Brachybacterium sp. J153]MEE1618590.1 ABC transporter substrate-binding protein [Brachybacterium sp. J153]
MKRRTLLTTGPLAAALVAGTAACSGRIQTNQGGGAPAGDGTTIPQLTFPSEVAENVAGIANFNPFAPNVTSRTYFYEPLMIRSSMNCEVVPWIATEFAWRDEQTLVFTIREGVTWSDGEPLTPDDVAFTLNLRKEYPGADDIGLWTDVFGAPAESVEVEGQDVVISFSGLAAAKFDSLITAKIMPQHVWGEVGDPTQYVDEAPVGTGPFALGSYNGRRLQLTRREDYWQADKVLIEELILEGNYDATNAALKLAAGELDAYWGEIPNPEQAFAAKDPELNHFWYAPAGSTVLTYNLTKAPFDDEKFREAVSQGLDKDEISAKATYSVMAPASQTGLKLPYAENLLPEAYAGQDTVLPFDTAKAEELLDAAGYTVGADGFRTLPDGSAFAPKFLVQAGWIDYQAAADVIVRNLQTMKINASVQTSPPEAVDQAKKDTNFDLLLEYLHGGCEVARNLGSKLASDQVPTEDTVKANVGRWEDPATDEIIAQLSGETDPEAQKELTGQLVEIMMTKYPVTPLFYAPARMIYRTDKAEGWPSEEDPYGTNSEMLMIITRLVPPSAS